MNFQEKAQLAVVIPVYNGAPFLSTLLARLLALPMPMEIIVVDDGSTDATQEIARGFQNVLCLSRAHAGVSAARNAGFAAATADVVAFLDVDDEWAADHPIAALKLMLAGQLDVAIGLTECLVEETVSSQPFHLFNVGSALIRREAFVRIGGFDESLNLGEDVDWFMRAREAGLKMALLDVQALRYRLHGANTLATPGAARTGLLQALQLSLARRRSAEETMLADLPHMAPIPENPVHAGSR